MDQPITKEQAVIITGYTGVLMCNFADYHAAVEARLGHPVWTHQFPELMPTIKEAFREDFLALVPK